MQPEDGNGLGQAEEESTEHRASDVAYPPEDRRGEGIQRRHEAHRGRHARREREEEAGGASEDTAEKEGGRDRPVDVDAHEARHLSVLCDRPDASAQLRVVDREVEEDEQREEEIDVSDDGIPAADDRSSAGSGCRSHGARNGQSTLSECGFLEHAHWTVPHNRAGGGNFLIEERDSLRTNIEAHQVFGSLCDVRDARGCRVGRFSENMIHRENKTEFAAARFFEKIPRKVQLVVFDQGLPHWETLRF